MKLNLSKEKIANLKKATICISFGTVSGLVTYGIFLYLNIAIFGWNLGLIFAPIVAGYVETYTAEKIIGESIGAISAFILFIVTVIYGFILKNPTLGVNAITFGSIIVIIQAALPTLINYFFLVVIIGILSYITGIFKKITDFIIYYLKKTYYKYVKKEKMAIDVKTVTKFDENLSNIKINSLDFLFLSMTDHPNIKIEKFLGIYEGTVILQKNKHLISTDYKEKDKTRLNKLKNGKDQALIKLANAVKDDGGNGVLNLSIEYELIGLGGDSYQIVARGNGVKLRKDTYHF